MRLLRQIWITLAVLSGAFALSWLYYMPNSDQRGVWRSETGGAILRLAPLQAALYSETQVSCLRQIGFPAHLKLVELAQGATLQRDGAQLLLTIDGLLDPLAFDRIEALPDMCQPPDPAAASPREVFDALWHAMNDHYAFFDLHGVDWAARRALAPDEAAQMSDEALFTLLSETLRGLDDRHVQLGAPFGRFSPAHAPDWPAPTSTLTRDSLIQTARDTLGTPLTSVDLTGIDYALLPDGIGYVLIRHLDIDTPFGAKSGPAMALAFAQVAEALQDSRAIILDLRFTPGGRDTAAFGVAGHFTSDILPVFSKTTRHGAGFSDPFEAAVRPVDDTPLDQPVAILTSQLTASAAEVLTLALRELPTVTLIGEPTSGSVSNVMGVKLPNGWELGLSNQIYRSAHGESFEKIGIPPDLFVEIDPAGMATGDDAVLRAAFVWARGL